MNERKSLVGSNNELYKSLNKSGDTLEKENKTVTSIRLPFSKFHEVQELADSHGLDRSKVLRRLIYTGLNQVKGESE